MSALPPKADIRQRIDHVRFSALVSHRNRIGKALAIEWLCDNWRVWHLFVDALDGIGIGVCGDEDDGYVAYLA